MSEPRMQEMLSQIDSRGISLDAPAPGGNHSLLDRLSGHHDQGAELERREQVDNLERVLGKARAELDARETFILDRRLLADPEERLSLAEIGEHFGVSRERVRQLELRARAKLRNEAERDDTAADVCAA